MKTPNTHTLIVTVGVSAACLLAAFASSSAAVLRPVTWNPARGILIEGATVVTMDDDHAVIPHGNVLVRDGRIEAVWAGSDPPAGVDVRDASIVRATSRDLLYPGLINLHDHPREDVLHTWPTPAYHEIPTDGKAGTDPYANRYQWGGGGASDRAPTELRRLIVNPASVLADELGLGLEGEMIKYAEASALLAGETAIQGAPRNPESDGVLVRNVDNDVFDARIAPPRVASIGAFGGEALARLRSGMVRGSYDAWIVHLAEGVRNSRRRPGDPVSSRGEFDTLRRKGLLTDMTVIVHGTALERSDFAALRSAPSIRADGTGDGRGAKLVWSPLSNLLLYGETTNVYEAMAEGVLVSLGTDWTPSGSRTLLQELKIADIALRDERVLGRSRDLVLSVSLHKSPPTAGDDAEVALDRALVDMVTRNPALTLRWHDKVGSIEPGKLADLLLLRRPASRSNPGLPSTVYRSLIDATERDVELVLVAGEPLAGDVALMTELKHNDLEIVKSSADAFEKALDVTTERAVPEGDERLAALFAELRRGLKALGGDRPSRDGGPGPVNNTYSYLKAHVAEGQAASMPDDTFRALLADQVGVLPDGSLNLERLRLAPHITADDDFIAHLLRGDLDPETGLIADPTPPFALYLANLNHIGHRGNPFEDTTAQNAKTDR